MFNYKVCLIGAPKSGKSSFAKKILTSNFTWEYFPTAGVEVHQLKLSTSIGDVILDLWDTAGSDNLRGLGDIYYIHADAAIIFYDATNSESLDIGTMLKHDFSKICENAQIFEWVNKCENEKNVRFLKNAEKISVCQGKYKESLLKIVRKLTACNDLVFISTSLSL